MPFTGEHLYFDDLEVGREWESPGRTITEADVASFAGLSGDFNPIHVDHHFARGTPYRRPVAHGLLVLSAGSGLSAHSPPVRTLAFVALREWHFRGPVYFGDTVRVRSKVLAKQARGRGRRGTVLWQRQVLNQDGKVVQEGVTETLVEGRSPTPAAAGEPCRPVGYTLAGH